MTEKTGHIRAAVFYDGHWFARVADHVASPETQWNARLSLHGLHAAFEHYLAPSAIDQVELTEVHYVRGRPSGSGTRTAWDGVLEQHHVVRHDVPLEAGKEVGADVELALTVVETVRNSSLNAVVLVTGDGDFAPLVSRLVRRGVRIVVPRVAAETTTGGGVLLTSRHLGEAGAETPLLDDLLTATQQPGYSGPALFVGQPGGAAEASGPGEREGVITRWEPGATHGFITDRRNVSWFVSLDETAGNRLPVGTRVAFTGRAKPLPGKRYPYARQVRSVDRDGS